MQIETIKINTENPYEVVIGQNIITKLSGYIKTVTNAEKFLIVTDDNVATAYLKKILAELTCQSEVFTFIIRSGEKSKNFKNYTRIIDFLAVNKFNRKDAIIAFGGGVVGDLCGFCAGTYMRGIDIIQIPTTILSAIDSSVGGKTAINLNQGKNLVGVFHQPKLVFIDIDFLKTLPIKEFQNGMGEAIKYFVLKDKNLINYCGLNLSVEKIIYLIKACIEIKADIVARDPHESGERMMLNLGHTLGHVFEKLSNYKISHGIAVAMGLTAILNIAVKYYGFSPKSRDNIIGAIKAIGIKPNIKYSIEEIINVIELDKKAEKKFINLIIPLKIGQCEIIKVEIKKLEEMLIESIN